MIRAQRELALKKFVVEKEAIINQIQILFVELFNECGQRYDGQTQLGLAGLVCAAILKSTNAPTKEKLQLLENLKRKA